MKEDLFLGIDPGAKGGYGIVDGQGGYVDGRQWKDPVFIYKNLYMYHGVIRGCFLERVNIFPREEKKFIVQMQSLLVSQGRWMQILDLIGIAYDLIAPATWQSQVGLYHWQARLKKLKNQGLAPGPLSTPWDRARREWPAAPIRGEGQSGIAVGLILADLARRHHHNPELIQSTATPRTAAQEAQGDGKEEPAPRPPEDRHAGPQGPGQGTPGQSS